jgi:hypothetical protein
MPIRNYTVTGTINCLFQPYKDFDNNATPPYEDLPAKESKLISGLEVQIWNKSPINVTRLGEGVTDVDGTFSIAFSDEALSDVDGQIANIFLLVYYNGILVSQYQADDNSVLIDLIR